MGFNANVLAPIGPLVFMVGDFANKQMNEK